MNFDEYLMQESQSQQQQSQSQQQQEEMKQSIDHNTNQNQNQAPTKQQVQTYLQQNDGAFLNGLSLILASKNLFDHGKIESLPKEIAEKLTPKFRRVSDQEILNKLITLTMNDNESLKSSASVEQQQEMLENSTEKSIKSEASSKKSVKLGPIQFNIYKNFKHITKEVFLEYWELYEIDMGKITSQNQEEFIEYLTDELKDN
mgnify:CR=1 FL=1